MCGGDGRGEKRGSKREGGSKPNSSQRATALVFFSDASNKVFYYIQEKRMRVISI